MKPFSTFTLVVALCCGTLLKAQELPKEVQLQAFPQIAICPQHVTNWAHVNVCTIYSQAGILYSGRVAEIGSCGPWSVANFQPAVVWEGSNASADVHDDHQGYELGSHTWLQPGNYVLKLGFEIDCLPDPQHNYHVRCPSEQQCGGPSGGMNQPGLVRVFSPMEPASLFIDTTQQYTPGNTYPNAASAALKGGAPGSGMLLKLTTNQKGKVDIQTSLGRTDSQHDTTFLWVPPDGSAQTFDILIDRTANASVTANITADCAGTIIPQSKCDPAQHPQKSASLRVQ